ncbi:MAG: hypothetical protein ACKO96_17025, partial [Flammeovirgaceae bacterium]
PCSKLKNCLLSKIKIAMEKYKLLVTERSSKDEWQDQIEILESPAKIKSKVLTLITKNQETIKKKLIT